MHSRSTEIAIEQAYFDAAAKHRARKLNELGGITRAAANAGAAAHLHRHADAARRAIGTADDAVAFGRMDDESGEVLYLGRHVIRDDNAEVLVVNWQAPAAARYFEASHQEPRGLHRRRTFDCVGNTVRDFTDVIFAELAAAVDQHLLAELARGRTGEMRDIVATIQAAQFALIRAPMDQLLVIEGGPGTGKTAVALHRVSWLLFAHAETLTAADVLVVGPHPTFIRYIGTVLPGLGDAEVELHDIGRLAPVVPRGRVEPAELSRIKGEARMAGLLARALEGRIGVPEPAERLLLDGRFVTLPGAEVAEALAACRAAELPYLGRRQLLRDRLGQLVADRTGGGTPAGQPAIANLVERLWPQQSAPAFLRDLFGSRDRLRAAAGTEFTADELARLHRRGADRLSQETLVRRRPRPAGRAGPAHQRPRPAVRTRGGRRGTGPVADAVARGRPALAPTARSPWSATSPSRPASGPGTAGTRSPDTCRPGTRSRSPRCVTATGCRARRTRWRPGCCRWPRPA